VAGDREALIVAPTRLRGKAEGLREYLEELGFRVKLVLREDAEGFDIWVDGRHFTDPANAAGYFALRRLRKILGEEG
jgi:hypothetical protein